MVASSIFSCILAVLIIGRENCYYRQSIRDTIVVHDPLKCICLESYRPVIALPEDPSQKGTVFNSIYFLQSDGKMTNALGRKLLNYEVKNAPVKEQRIVDLTRDMAGLCCAGSGYQNIEPRENDPIRNWLGKEDKEVVLLRQQRADFEAIREWHAHFI